MAAGKGCPCGDKAAEIGVEIGYRDIRDGGGTGDTKCRRSRSPARVEQAGTVTISVSGGDDDVLPKRQTSSEEDARCSSRLWEN